MPAFHITRSVPIERTPRVLQLEGMFDLPPNPTSGITWIGNLPLEERAWTIGLIVGPSGSGKSTLARELFGSESFAEFDWPSDKSVIDAFPSHLSIRDVTALLSSVGFSSPPAWLRPFGVLSTGEKFRATLARALALGKQTEEKGTSTMFLPPAAGRTIVVDEFTSVVDRTVARIGSAAIAKAIRRETSGQRFVAVSCHDDILDWLDPDWTYAPANDTFQWRLERPGTGQRARPQVALEISRVDRTAWKLFKHHHYLNGDLHPKARCFVAFVEGKPAAFTAVIFFPHPQASGYREHRTVCLPDFQGIGIGNALSEFVASLFAATGRPYYSATSHPAMIRHRLRSPLWNMTHGPNMGNRNRIRGWKRSLRLTAGFRFMGPSLALDDVLRLMGPTFPIRNAGKPSLSPACPTILTGKENQNE